MVDPSVLSLEVDEHGALRHQRILEASSDRTGNTESERDYGAWKNRRARLLNEASRPSISVQTVTALASSSTSERVRVAPPVQIDEVERSDPERPKGRRFGALVHATLASVNLDADAEAVQASAATSGKMVGSSEEEVDAAVVAVRAALAHPLLRRAAASAKERAILL